MNQLLLIYTGGTIGGVAPTDEDIQAVQHDRNAKKFFESVKKNLPRCVKNIDCQIISPFRKLSEQMTPTDWDKLASSVDSAIQNGFRAVVIAHGTDTLSYSAAALSMMLQNPPIPIVFTGSNKPLEAEGTDAIQNLAHAFYFAANTDLHGVFVTFAGSPNGRSLILKGVRVRKDASRSDAFQPTHGKAIGQISSGFLSKMYIDLNISEPRISGEDNYHPCLGISDAVEMFDLYPGFNKNILTSAVSDRGVKAIILSAYGLGTACTEGEHGLAETLKKLINAGVPIFIISRHFGKINLSQYGSSAMLERIGCVGLGSMTPETALAKLMWVVARKNTFDEIRELMLKDIAGEFD
jgi:glutamyl-tRNA(Gln) amidotransferase subunit D